jgi:hypothetical protein
MTARVERRSFFGAGSLLLGCLLLVACGSSTNEADRGVGSGGTGAGGKAGAADGGEGGSGGKAGGGVGGGSGGGAGAATAGAGGYSAGQGGATAGAGGAPTAGTGGESAGQGGAFGGSGDVPAGGAGGSVAGAGGALAGAGGALAGAGGALAGAGGALAGAGGALAGAGGAAACNTLENGAPTHVGYIEMGAPPERSAFTGGQIASGTYFRTTTRRYLPTLPPGPDSTIKETISISQSDGTYTIQGVLSDSSSDSHGADERSSYTATMSGPELRLTRTCPSAADATVYFSYANNTLTILDVTSARLMTYARQVN